MDQQISIKEPSKEMTALERIQQDHNVLADSAMEHLFAIRSCITRIKNTDPQIEGLVLIEREDTLMDAFGKTLYNMKVLHDSLSALRRELESIV